MQLQIIKASLSSMALALVFGTLTTTAQAGPNDRQSHKWGHVDYRYSSPHHHAPRHAPPPRHAHPRYHRAPPPHANAWGHKSRYDQRVNYHRGGYLPRQYLSSPYYVSDWRRHPGLYAPPRDHRWVKVDDRYMLAAVATGLIASIILAH